ncbi:MAG: TraB/GumN family protein [Betaproteobacteria bacterium]
MHRSATRYLRRLLLIVAALAAGNVLAQQTGATPLVWEVRSASNAVYLLGSIHLGRSDMYPLGPVVEKAYQAAKVVALEADPTDPQAVMAAVAASLYQPPETLQKNLPSPMLARLSRTLERYGIALEQVQPMKPFLVAITLASIEYVNAGFDPSLGVDVHFARRARQDGKPVVQLESFGGQIALMNNLSGRLQESLLQETLESIDNGEIPALVDSMVRAWKSGDAKKLQDAVSTEERKLPSALAQEFHRHLISDRNIAMAEKIETMLKGTDAHFIVIGAAHLPGQDGVLQILSAKGNRVSPL